MSTLAPKLQSDIAYERPVGAAPSVLEALAGTISGLAGDFVSARSRSGMSAADQKSAALQPFIAEQNRIADLNITQQEKNRLSDANLRSFIQNNGAYADDAKSILEGTFGFETGQGDFDRVQKDLELEWLRTTPQGHAAAAEAASLRGQGNVSDDSLAMLVTQRWYEDTARKTQIDALAQNKSLDEVVWREMSPSWTQRASDMANSLMVLASSDPSYTEDPLTALDELTSRKKAFTDMVRSEALAANMAPAQIEAKMAEVVKPLEDLETMFKSQMENPQLLLRATDAATTLGLQKEFVKALGPMGAHPELRRPLMEFIVQNQYEQDGVIEAVLGAVVNGDFAATVDLGVDLPPGISEAASGTAAVTTPEKVSEFKTQIEGNPDLLPATLSFAAQSLGIDDLQTQTTALNRLVIAGEAADGPFGVGVLRKIFSPENVANLSKLDETGKSALASFMVNQVKQNRALVASNGSLFRDYRVREEGGRFVVEKRGRFGTTDWSPVNDKSEIAQTVKAVNFLMDMSAKFPELKKQITNATNWLYRGVEPSADMLEEDITWGDLEHVTHVSYQAPNQLVVLIDQTEGGGEYDTLFGYSQREGNKFSGVDVSSMTIGQALEFSSPTGAYGQWVKGEIGRVATPMGRYQYVGTTLREITKEMGLPLNTVFNKQTQDAIFDYHVRKIISGKTDKAAAQALRGTWEGFQSVSDADLMNAVAQFRGSPGRPYDSLPTGTGVTPSQTATAAFYDGARPQARPELDLNGFEVSDRSRSAQVDDTGVAEVNTEDARQGSRVAARDERAQLIAMLMNAGYTDAEAAEIAARKQAEG